MSGHWQARPEGGGRIAVRAFGALALLGGRRLARSLLYPITAYYLLRRGPERRASRAFLGRVLDRPVRWRDVWRHIHCFSATVLDRLFLLARGVRGFDIEVRGLEALESVLAQGRGVMLMGSHLGSFEALRALSASYPDVPLRVVLDRSQSPLVNDLLDRQAPDVAERIIDGSRGPASVVLALSEAAAQGHMIALLADRGRPGEAMCRVPFLGQPAPFPAGPWQVAAALKLPVVLCFGLYRGGRRYVLTFELFDDRVILPRQHREAALESCVRRYAARLEHHARRAPYNWFNFYDFWHDPEAPTAPVRTADADPGVIERPRLRA